MTSHSIYEVFTPTSPARLNFVARNEIEAKLTDFIMTPGKQIIVYGETGSGKSSLLGKQLERLYERHITTRCTRGTTFQSMLLGAFDQLDATYTESRIGTVPQKSQKRIEANLGVFRAGLDKAGSQEQTTSKRALEPQLTAQRLGETMGELGVCWVIEDFHKILSEEKVHIAQTLKVFSDLSTDYPRLKIIAVGATDTAREVIEYDREMKNRVAEMHVPLMSDGEITAILDGGGQILNVSFRQISHDVVRFSAGLPGVCHNFALNSCTSRGIYDTQDDLVLLDKDDCENAIARYVDESSDTLKSVFERALKRHRTKKFDNCKIILTALCKLDVEGASHAEILREIRKSESDYPASSLTIYLRALCTEERGAVLRATGGGKYRYSEPLFRSYAQAVLAPQALGADIISEWFSVNLQSNIQRIVTTSAAQWTIHVGSPTSSKVWTTATSLPVDSSVEGDESSSANN